MRGRLPVYQAALRVGIAAAAAVLAGCGGGGSNPNAVGPVTSVTLSPSPTVSLNAGEVLAMTVAATDARGTGVLSQTFTFASSNNSQIQIANNGMLCAGTWDSLVSPVNCNPAAPGVAGISTNLTAMAQGVTSNTVTAFVHARVATLKVLPSPAPAGGCVSQTGTENYQVQALDASGNDISNSIGLFNWLVQDTEVGAASAATTTTPTNTMTAKLPGLTTLSVSVNSVNPVNSLSTAFEECPVASITLTPSPVLFGAVGNTQQLTKAIVDSLGATVSTAPPISLTTTAPAVATADSNGVLTAVNPGTTGVVAGCVPNFCNINLNEPVYSNLALATVPGTHATTVYVSGSAATGIIPINTSTNSMGMVIGLPQMPNSFVFDVAGDRAFLGSATELMLFNPASNAVTTLAAPGRVLAVSNNGDQALVSNATSVFLVTVSTGTVNTLNIANASGADFTPDGAKAFVTSGSSLFTVETGTGLASVALPAATAAPVTTGPQQSVAVLAGGAAGYVAASGVPFFPTCAVTPVGKADASQSPQLVAALPDGSGVVGVDGTGGKLDFVQVSVSVNPAASSNPAAVCTPTITNTASQVSLNASGFTPEQVIITSDAKHIYVTGSAAGKLLRDDVGGVSTAIALSSATATTFTAAALTDGTTVYVGGSDGNVHVIDVASGSDKQEIPMTFTPDLVAVKP